MATFVLEDMAGRIEVVAFPDAFGKHGAYIREGQLLLVKGRYQGEGENRRISLSQATPLADAFETQAKRVIVRVFLPGLEEATISELKSILDAHEGKCPVFFELETPHSYRVVARSAEVLRVAPTEDLLKKIEALLGENSVSVDY